MTSDPSDAWGAELDGFPVASDAENFHAREPLELLMSRYAEELRRGEAVTVEDYARRYPDLAEEIRELFPLAKTLERWKADKEVECLRRAVPEEFPIRYSLGLTLYELVTQTPAFSAPNRQQLAELILRTTPKPPREICRQIPRSLETIILTAAAQDAADRYASAADLAADLLRYLNGEPIYARLPGLLRRAARWTRRKL